MTLREHTNVVTYTHDHGDDSFDFSFNLDTRVGFYGVHPKIERSNLVHGTNHDYKHKGIQVFHTETKLKALGCLKIYDDDLNA